MIIQYFSVEIKSYLPPQMIVQWLDSVLRGRERHVQSHSRVARHTWKLPVFLIWPTMVTKVGFQLNERAMGSWKQSQLSDECTWLKTSPSLNRYTFRCKL